MQIGFPPYEGAGDFLNCWLSHGQEEPGFSGNQARMASAQAAGWRRASEPVWAPSALINQQKTQVITTEKCKVPGPLKLRVKENDSLMALHQKLNRKQALSIPSSASPLKQSVNVHYLCFNPSFC